MTSATGRVFQPADASGSNAPERDMLDAVEDCDNDNEFSFRCLFSTLCRRALQSKRVARVVLTNAHDESVVI
jgi:hypothetical protein